jgi:hypothetical protein
VFLDETAASTNMARRYGRASRGERCRIAVPHGHDKTTTVTAAPRAIGLAAIAVASGWSRRARWPAAFRLMHYWMQRGRTEPPVACSAIQPEPT